MAFKVKSGDQHANTELRSFDAAVAVVVNLLGLEVLLTLVDGVGSNAVVLIIFLVTTLLEIKCDQGTILTPI